MSKVGVAQGVLGPGDVHSCPGGDIRMAQVNVQRPVPDSCPIKIVSQSYLLYLLSSQNSISSIGDLYLLIIPYALMQALLEGNMVLSVLNKEIFLDTHLRVILVIISKEKTHLVSENDPVFCSDFSSHIG